MPSRDPPPASAIKHVFVLMLENHSFDNMLALSGIPGIDAATGADSNSYKCRKPPHRLVPCPFGPNAPPSMPTDPGHEFPDVYEQLTGGKLDTGGFFRWLLRIFRECGLIQKHPLLAKYPPINNSGFAENYNTTTSEGKRPKEDEVCDIMLGFVTQQALPNLWTLATNFAVCDHWFSSLPGPKVRSLTE
jgi:phospholipase C